VALQTLVTVQELEAFWRPLTDAESSRATTLLLVASNRLRLVAENLGINLDEKVNNSEIYKSNVQYVVMEATKRALLTPVDAPPANSVQQTAGPYSQNITFTNPSGDLWFKKSDLAEIGLSGSQSLNSISTTRKELYS
jgi:hypothetical protein